jgi:hypothetical protein
LAVRSADQAFCPLFNSLFGAQARTLLLWRWRFVTDSNFGNLSFSFCERKVQNDFCFCGIIKVQPKQTLFYFVLKEPSWTIQSDLFWLHQGGFLSALGLSI